MIAIRIVQPSLIAPLVLQVTDVKVEVTKHLVAFDERQVELRLVEGLAFVGKKSFDISCESKKNLPQPRFPFEAWLEAKGSV